MIWSASKGWIGVDLGTHTVKLAQVERRAGRMHLADALVIRRHEPWSVGQDGTEPGPRTSSEEIRAGLSLGTEFSGRNAAAVASMALCDVRELAVPSGRRSELRSWVGQELHAASDRSAESSQFDYWPIDPASERSTADENLIALSMHQNWSAQIAEDLSRAGLRGRVLDGLPLALARAVTLGSEASAGEPVVAVDWGCQRATVCGVQDGRPYFVRCLRGAGFSGVLQTLCQALSVTHDEAHKLLIEHGLPNRKLNLCEDLQKVIEEVTAAPLNAFIGELTRTIAFMRRQRRRPTPTQMVLFGGGASVKNLTSFLLDQIDLPAKPWRLAEDEFGEAGPSGGMPIELLGPAIALSSLAWD